MNNEELKDLSFEDALLQLESGRIKLDDAVSAYEKAVVLKQLCETKLKAAQLKIEKIEVSPEGKLSTAPFEVPEA